MTTSNNINIKSEKITRFPIITIAGHIDHGKTTLLNILRQNEKISKEHGGITQYIKPYNIKTKFGNMTFLDTPGHFAFNSIRKKSIKYSDIVILIIAADDGIKPQTIETIEISKKYNIPIIVAINKIDKIDKTNEKIITELSKYNLTPEKWGGDTLMAFISAKTGKGIDDLIDLINLQTEILDLKANADGPADGFILDNRIDKGKGPIATIIILNGILKKGDVIQIKNTYGKVKTILDDFGHEIKNSHIATPLYITGLPNSIEIGERFNIKKDIKDITPIKTEPTKTKVKKKYDITDLIKNLKITQQQKINIIVKADVQGSINVLKETINELPTDKIKINIIKIEMGHFKTSDINLSVTTNAILIGFNVKCDSKTKKLAENNSIKINTFNVIYDIIDYIKNIIEKKILDETKENITGVANVKRVFKQETSIIAGCIITHGKIKQNAKIKIFRKNNIIHDGIIESIKIFKTDINEVKAGNECGIIIKNYNNIQINDKIKIFSLQNAPERN